MVLAPVGLEFARLARRAERQPKAAPRRERPRLLVDPAWHTRQAFEAEIAELRDFDQLLAVEIKRNVARLFG